MKPYHLYRRAISTLCYVLMLLLASVGNGQNRMLLKKEVINQPSFIADTKELPESKTKNNYFSNEKYGFEIHKQRKITKIPFLLQANLILVPLVINNSDTLWFILDTGVNAIILTDSVAINKLNMPLVREIKLQGIGEGHDVEAGITLGNTIKMGEMIGYKQNVLVIKNNAVQLSEYVGVPIHGVWGFDLFDRFVVTIDFANQEIILQEPDSYSSKHEKGERFPISIEKSKPYFVGLQVESDKESKPLKLLIDTGANHALFLEKPDTSLLQMPDKIINTQLGRGLNGIIHGKLGRIKKMKVGSYEINNLIASFPDTTLYKDLNSNRQGAIGCELLRRFKVTFNYREHYVLLKPFKKILKEAFEYNMSGMELVATGKDYRSFIVDNIIEGSPAYQVGIKEGDLLIAINKTIAKEMLISDVYKMLQQGEGKTIELVLQRKGQLVVKRFTLERII